MFYYKYHYALKVKKSQAFTYHNFTIDYDLVAMHNAFGYQISTNK